jgi:aminomethyltransferase
VGSIRGVEVLVGRTGYTGEPLCFELMLPAGQAARVWDLLLSAGAAPVGLGARDTLRLEAALPLYGHELGIDLDGREIPIFACPPARFAVSFSPAKGDFVGRTALTRQHEAYKRLQFGDQSLRDSLPRLVQPLALVAGGVARAGAKVYSGRSQVGYVTSGTMVPYWEFEGEAPASRPSDRHALRAIALALIDSRLRAGQGVAVDVRGSWVEGRIVPRHLHSTAPPYARPALWPENPPRRQASGERKMKMPWTDRITLPAPADPELTDRRNGNGPD